MAKMSPEADKPVEARTGGPAGVGIFYLSWRGSSESAQAQLGRFSE